jgi:hypothetical protein
VGREQVPGMPSMDDAERVPGVWKSDQLM